MDFLSPCTEIEWERRPLPPSALRGFDFVSISYVSGFPCDGFLIPGCVSMVHKIVVVL